MPTKSDLESGTRSVAIRGDGRSSRTPHKQQSATAALPWQERPAGCRDVMWRHAGNPIIGRNHMPGVQGIYNSAVSPYGDGFVGVFRLQKQDRFTPLHLG